MEKDNGEKIDSNTDKITKGMHTILEVMFILSTIFLLEAIFLKIAYFSKYAKTDMVSIQNLLIRIIVTLFLFLNLKSVKAKKVSAGYIGIVIGILEMIFGGLIYKIMGIVLFIYSILFIINYYKKENS